MLKSSHVCQTQCYSMFVMGNFTKITDVRIIFYNLFCANFFFEFNGAH